MGGIGKAVLAAALARDEEVCRVFPEVLWITVTQHPDLVRLQLELASALGEDGLVIRSAHEGKRKLQDLCRDRAILLVLDDRGENVGLQRIPAPSQRIDLSDLRKTGVGTKDRNLENVITRDQKLAQQ